MNKVMKPITVPKKKYLKQFQSTCPNFDGEVCKTGNGQPCICETLAEMWAYVSILVPAECYKLHLQDFSGTIPGTGKQVLSDDTVLQAKNLLIRYIWGKVDPSEIDGFTDFTQPNWARRCELSHRRMNGNSLVIHGTAKSLARPDESTRGEYKKLSHRYTENSVRHPMGKTLLASIVMKEILRMRLLPGHEADTYEWVSFPTLMSQVMSNNSEHVTDYQTCDWLVVDNIQPQSKAQRSEYAKAFHLDKLNGVFAERNQNQTPTILVLKFDLNDYEDLENEVGEGLAELIRDRKTLKINLSDLSR